MKIIYQLTFLRTHLSRWEKRAVKRNLFTLFLLWMSCVTNAAAEDKANFFFLAPDRPIFRTEMTQLDVLLQKRTLQQPKFEFIPLPHYDSAEYAKLEYLIKALALKKPVAIVTPDMSASGVAVAHGISVPFVTGGLADPVAMGLVKDAKGKRTNVTGYTKYVNIDERRLALLREISPGSRRIGVFYDDIIMSERKARNGDKAAYIAKGAKVIPFKVELLSEALEIIGNSKALGIDSWYIQLMPHNYEKSAAIQIVKAVNTLKLPAIYENMSFVDYGGLASYESVLFEPELIWAQNLQLLLEGIKAAQIPFAEPRHFFLTLNTDEAKRLNLRIPQQVLRRVDLTFPCTAKPPLDCKIASPQKF